jgi:hypothetical protein
MLILPKTQLSQPQGRPVLAPEWAAAGFLFADIPSRSIKLDATFPLSNRVTPHGEAFHIPQATNSRAFLDQAGGFSFAGDFTWLILLERLSAYSGSWATCFICELDTGGSPRRSGFGFQGTTGRPYIFYRNAANSGWEDIFLGQDFPLSTPTLFVATRKDGTVKFFADGQLVEEKTAGNGLDMTGATARFLYGSGQTMSSTQGPAMNIYLAAVGYGALSDFQVKSLSENPYQLFKSSSMFMPSEELLLPPTNLNFSNIQQTSMRLNWTAPS